MRIGRTLAPAAAPIGWGALLGAAAGILSTRDPAPDLEAELRQTFGVDHVWLVSSGTAALTLTLLALRAERRQTDVVIPAYTCFSVPAAVLRAGLRPVLCDVDPRTLDFDSTLLPRAISANTLCVVAHDLFGIPSNIDRVRALCRSRDITVVEDAAQGMGVASAGGLLGTRGDVGILSLGRGKHLTCGSGGVILTRSARIAGAVDAEYSRLPAPTRGRMLRDWLAVALMTVFIRPSLFWIPAAMPWLHLGETIFPKRIHLGRLSRMHATLLRHWRRRLAASNERRAQIASTLAGRLSLDLPCGPRHPYLRLPVLATTAMGRHRLLAASRAKGLGFGRGYPTSVAEIPEVAAAIGPRRFATATQIAARLLTLPTHHWVSARDAGAIVDCLERAADASRAMRQEAS